MYCGNLDAYQGIPLLLQAVRRVREKLPAVMLKIVSFADVTRTRALVLREGLSQAVSFVRPAGFNAELDLLNEASVCACPRVLRAGFPMKILNYMAAARPVVVTQAGAKGLGQLEHAWIAKDGEPESFAEGLVTLLQDRGLAERVARQARLHVEKEHSRSTFLDRLEALYERLLGAPAR